MDKGRQSAFRFLFSALCFSLLISCVSPAQPSQTEVITAYATTSAQPWMQDLFACANEKSIIVKVTADDPDIALRVGEPETLVSPAYQIGEEELLIVTHRQSLVQNLTLQEVQVLFAGQGDPSMQVWVYSSGMDVQRLFDQFVMEERSVTSFARIAVNPQEMSDILNSESNTIGILPKRWMAGDVREVYSIGTFPILAVTKEEPEGAAKLVLGCLQDN